MSVAAREASLLFDFLGRFNSDLLSTLAHDFLTKAENLIADPWALSLLKQRRRLFEPSFPLLPSV